MLISFSMSCVAFLNSRMDLPNEANRPGSLLAPKKINTTKKMMISSMGPMFWIKAKFIGIWNIVS